jgi:FKBP-type peptidyl-prolyl cis-trans isomerase
MNKENIAIVVAIIILVAGLVYVISSIGKPPSELVKNLTETPKEQMTQKPKLADLEKAAAEAGLVKNDVKEGTGNPAKEGDTLTVNYIGTFPNGTEFDNSYKRGAPFDLTLGEGGVIAGWEIGLLGAKAGGKRELTIPPVLGYGDQGSGSIPGGATLKFTIEVVSIKANTSTDSVILNL